MYNSLAQRCVETSELALSTRSLTFRVRSISPTQIRQTRCGMIISFHAGSPTFLDSRVSSLPLPHFPTPGKYKECTELLTNGAMNLLKHQQYGSATDLCRRILEVYEAAGTEVNDASIAPFVQLFEHFDLQSTFAIEFVRETLRWSGKNGAHPAGDPYLQHIFGMRYFKAKDYYQAETHFVNGTVDSAKALGWMAFQWAEEGYPCDKGYFITRGVMMWESLG